MSFRGYYDLRLEVWGFRVGPEPSSGRLGGGSRAVPPPSARHGAQQECTGVAPALELAGAGSGRSADWYFALRPMDDRFECICRLGTFRPPYKSKCLGKSRLRKLAMSCRACMMEPL